MHRKVMPVIAAVALSALTPGAIAQSKKRPKAGNTTISKLDARPNPVVFLSATTVSGRLAGSAAAGTAVRLQADSTRPYGDKYDDVATVTSDPSGKFAFAVKPALGTQYRAIAELSPRLTSAGRLVSVRTKVGFNVSDRTPKRGSRVRFAGLVRPAKDGRAALIQRRSATGRFVTVARTVLHDAGTDLSTYGMRVRVRRDGVYRIKVPGDLEHVNGFSKRITLDVS